MQAAFGQGVEDDRELSSSARRLDPLVSRVFGEAQLVQAVGEHGRVGRWQVEPTRIHLGDVGQERRSRGAILCDEQGQTRRRSPSLTWESEYTDMYCLFTGAHRGGSCLRLVDCNGGVFGALTAPQPDGGAGSPRTRRCVCSATASSRAAAPMPRSPRSRPSARTRASAHRHGGSGTPARRTPRRSRVALRHATVEPGERDVRLPALGVKGRELIRRICGAPGHLP